MPTILTLLNAGPLSFEIPGLYPKIPATVRDWLDENKILFRYQEQQYGPGAFHYQLYIHFENEDDAALFKLRWDGSEV